MRKVYIAVDTRRLNPGSALMQGSRSACLICNHFHIPDFLFTTSETMCDIYLKHGIYELSQELQNDLSFMILGN